MALLMLMLMALLVCARAPTPDEKRSELLTRLKKGLDDQDLRMTDLPEDERELADTLAELGFSGLERTQLRKILSNSTQGSASKKPTTRSASTIANDIPVVAIQKPPEEIVQPETSAAVTEDTQQTQLSADEELAKRLQEEEYAAARAMNNSAANGGNGGQFGDFLKELMGQSPGSGTASGVIIRRTVPGDHSCLFSAIAYVAEGPDAANPGKANELREVCAQDVLKDPDPAKRAVMLGVNNVDEYAKWIRNSEHWGGENEIIVLAKHYNLEVAVVSSQSMRIITYTPENTNNATRRCYLLYTGQHYDPLVAAPSADSPNFEERRTFPKGDRAYDRLALEAAKKHIEQPQITLQVNMPFDKKDKDKEFTPINDTGNTFEDVKGCDEAKDEVKEVVLYLKDPDRFTRLGAKLPRGILLTGSPGTGKTLMARAVAGEAKATFLQTSGSEFDEEYVGVGARRIRNLFEQARNHSPCIVFMDELDAVGGKRQSREASYHRQTLNQLLVEVDGFKQNKGLVLIAATNFPEALDPALTRAGRIDKTIHIPLPDLRGRLDILGVHAKNITLENTADLSKVAQRTTGMSGADLANLLNIAAIRASAEGLPYVPMLYLEEAYDRVAVGASRRSPMSTEEKNTTAYHEGGHTLVSIKTVGTDPIHKATILPRGNALGITWSVREGEKYSERLFELQAKMDMIMGGRAAEEVIFGPQNISGGCSSDLQSATRIAKQMVMHYGMGGASGELSMYYDPHDYQALSDQHKNDLDNRIQVLIKDSYGRAVNCLERNVGELHMLADALMTYETLDAEEIRMAIEGKKGAIQERHDAYKAKIADYTAQANALGNVSADEKDELQAAIALSLGAGGADTNQTSASSALSAEADGAFIDNSWLGRPCAVASFVLALIALKEFHSFRKPMQQLHEPLMK